MNTSILTIDPGSRFWGVSVFSGGEIMLWKVLNLSTKDSPGNRLSQVRRVFLSLVKKHTPRILIIKKPYRFWEKQSPNLQKVIEEIMRLARKNKIKIVEFSPDQVRKTLCQNEHASKDEIAQIVARHQPEFKDFLIQSRTYKDRYQWGRMVTSMALGFCYLRR